MAEFSVIVPVYKVEKYLRRCVDSILSQKDADFEVILVDDGSPDNCGVICDEYAAKDDRVNVIHQENKGLSGARNSGINSSKGEYLVFVDSDDYWNSEMGLYELSKVIKENDDLDIVCFGVNIITEDGKLIKTRKPTIKTNDFNNKYETLETMIYGNEYISTSYVKAIKRKLIIDNSIYFIDRIYSEDIEWSARLMVLCQSIGISEIAFYDRMIRNEGAITSSIGRKNVLDILKQIENGVEFAKEHAEDEAFLDLYYEYWAYQYAMLLGFCRRIRKDDDFPGIKNRMKKLSWLLNYDHVSKVKLVKTIYKLSGIDITMFILEKYYTTKK
ncbi:MAG: glycosyltransferase [Erysipelotrichaceae bacterium]|nr:glycosyltransferase [Erysipelotrichaceae bacterium]